LVRGATSVSLEKKVPTQTATQDERNVTRVFNLIDT